MLTFEITLTILVVMHFHLEFLTVAELPEPPGYKSISKVPDEWLYMFITPEKDEIQAFLGCYEVHLPSGLKYPYWAKNRPEVLQFELFGQQAENKWSSRDEFTGSSNLLGGWPLTWSITKESEAAVGWGDGYEGIVVDIHQSSSAKMSGSARWWSCTGSIGPFEINDISKIQCSEMQDAEFPNEADIIKFPKIIRKR